MITEGKSFSGINSICWQSNAWRTTFRALCCWDFSICQPTTAAKIYH